jgi:hypothetical protein
MCMASGTWVMQLAVEVFDGDAKLVVVRLVGDLDIAAAGKVRDSIKPTCDTRPARGSHAGRDQDVTWLDPPQEVGPPPNPGRFRPRPPRRPAVPPLGATRPCETGRQDRPSPRR